MNKHLFLFPIDFIGKSSTNSSVSYYVKFPSIPPLGVINDAHGFDHSQDFYIESPNRLAMNIAPPYIFRRNGIFRQNDGPPQHCRVGYVEECLHQDVVLDPTVMSTLRSSDSFSRSASKM